MSLSLVLVGTHLRGRGASDQMITCSQSTDTSAKHDHSPAHCKAWGERSRHPGRTGGTLFYNCRHPTGPVPHFWALTDL